MTDLITPGMPVCALVRLDGIAYLTGEVFTVSPTHLVLVRVTWHRQLARHHEWVAGTTPSTEREQYPPAQRVALRLADVPKIILDWPGDLDAGSL